MAYSPGFEPGPHGFGDRHTTVILRVRMVGVAGFEPAITDPPGQCLSQLDHTPKIGLDERI